jgi:streptogrisin C
LKWIKCLFVMATIAMIVGATVSASATDSPNGSNTPAEQATEPEYDNPDPIGSDATQLASDVGISVDEARAAIERQAAVGQLQAAMEARGPRAFGGLFIDYKPEYRVTILSRPGGGPEVSTAVRSLGFADLEKFVAIRETPFTRDVLANALTRVENVARSNLTTLDLDIRTGQVLATAATPADVSAVRSVVAANKATIPAREVVVEQGTFQDEDVYGGLHADSSLGNCTSGFSVSRTTDGTSGVTDAAHCPNSSVTISGVSASFVDGKWGDSQDVQWFTTSQAEPNKIKDADGGSTRAITSRTDRSAMVVGGSVCHYGRNSSGCGTIASKDFNPGDFDSHTYNSTFIRVDNDDTVTGDSGCPWYLGNSAYGTHKGSTTNGDDPVFMAQNYMSALNLVVKIN